VDLEEVENAEYAISVFYVRESQRNQLKAVADAAEQKCQRKLRAKLKEEYLARLKALQRAKLAAEKAAEDLRVAEQADLKLQQLKQRALEADHEEVTMLENVLDLALRLEEKANASSQQSHTNIIPNMLSVQQNTVPPRTSLLAGPSATGAGRAVGRITRQST
jgi:hypothetical protein